MVRSPYRRHLAEVSRDSFGVAHVALSFSLKEALPASSLEPWFPELTVPAAAPKRWAYSGAGPTAPRRSTRPAGAAGSAGASDGLARTRALGPGRRWCRGTVRCSGAGRPAACSHWHHSQGEHARRPAARRRSERSRRSARPGPARPASACSCGPACLVRRWLLGAGSLGPSH